jgi:hemerythrin superfamily protein
MTKRETYIKPTIITDRKLIEQLAQDLVEGHNAKAYNLEYWPAAREFVTRFHRGEEKAQPRRGN